MYVFRVHLQIANCGRPKTAQKGFGRDSVQCAQCTVYSAQSVQYSKQCTVGEHEQSAQCAVQSVQYAQCTLQPVGRQSVQADR